MVTNGKEKRDIEALLPGCLQQLHSLHLAFQESQNEIGFHLQNASNWVVVVVFIFSVSVAHLSVYARICFSLLSFFSSLFPQAHLVVCACLSSAFFTYRNPWVSSTLAYSSDLWEKEVEAGGRPHSDKLLSLYFLTMVHVASVNCWKSESSVHSTPQTAGGWLQRACTVLCGFGST